MSTNWPMVRLWQVLKPISREEAVDTTKEYRLLGVRLDGNGPFLREVVSGTKTAASKLYRVARGDFIYSRLFACRGAFGIISDDLDGCYVSGEFPTFLSPTNLLDINFLRYWFRLPATLSRVNEDCTGSTPLTRNRFKEQFFLDLEVPLPPMEDQQRIVAKLDELATKIDEARTLRQQSAKETEVLMVSAVSTYCFGGHPLHTFGDFLSGAKNGIYKPPFFWGKGLPCIRMYNIDGPSLNQARLQLLEVTKEEIEIYGCNPGDLVFNRVNSAELVGKTGLVTQDYPLSTFESKNMRLRVDRSRVLPEFAALVLNSVPVRTYYRQVLKQQCGMATLNQAHVHNIPFPSLGISEQSTIVKKVSTLHLEVDRAKQIQTETAAELGALLPSILDRAFKGEL